MSIRFVTPGLSSPRRTSRPESVTAERNFFRTVSRSSRSLHRSLRRAAGRRHLPLGVLQVHDPRAHLGIDALGQLERLAEAAVEAHGDVAGQLEMLPLVVADRDDVGLVEQDVARHQHRIGEERGRDELALLGLLLELRHPLQLAEARDRAEQPRGLGVRGHVALCEDGRALGVEPGREQHRRQVERLLAEVVGVVLDADRVQVDDAEEPLALLLGRRVLAEAADQVAEVLVAGGLDAGEDAHLRSISTALPAAEAQLHSSRAWLQSAHRSS